MDSWLTAGLTIIGGVFLFILCEYIKERWLNPAQEYKQIKGKIAYALILYANVYGTPHISTDSQKSFDEHDAASNELRALAATVGAFIETMPKIHPWIPSRKALDKAEGGLLGLSNGMWYHNDTLPSVWEMNLRRCEEIEQALHLYKKKESST